MIPSRYKRLLEELHKQTPTGSVTWTPSERPNTYSTQIGRYRIDIFRLEDKTLFLVPAPGTICAELVFSEDENVFDHYPVYSTGCSDYKELSDLYEIARLSATEADIKLNEIITLLTNPDNRPTGNPTPQ